MMLRNISNTSQRMIPKKPILQTYALLAIIGYCLAIPPVNAQDYKGAACVIFVNIETVLVRDLLSNRLSFPCGYLHSGESPEQAAQRESYEETGLNVTLAPPK